MGGLIHISSNISPHDDIIGEVGAEGGGSLCDAFFAFPSSLIAVSHPLLGQTSHRMQVDVGGGGFFLSIDCDS